MPPSPSPHALARALRAGVLACAMAVSMGAAAAVEVGRFSTPAPLPPAPWQEIRFDTAVPPTRYRIRAWDGVMAIEAESEASMSLLARPIQVDLQATPVLCWRWRIENRLDKADLRHRAGDDYAARVYLGFRLPPASLGLATRAGLALARARHGEHVPDAALNYVWDNRHPVGTEAPNAYTERTRMIVLRSNEAATGRWQEERRDIATDAAAAFGEEGVELTLLAVATDTDNTGERARAGFADLHFVARGAQCRFPPDRP